MPKVDGRTTRIIKQNGELNPNAKLTTEDVLWIRKDYEDGATPSEIAKHFNTSRSNISNIVARRIWRHI